MIEIEAKPFPQYVYRTLDESAPIEVRALLVQLIEEANEIQKPACKALRVGLGSSNPFRPEEGTNQHQIAVEIGDLLGIMDVMLDFCLLDSETINEARQLRRRKARAMCGV